MKIYTQDSNLIIYEKMSSETSGELTHDMYVDIFGEDVVIEKYNSDDYRGFDVKSINKSEYMDPSPIKIDELINILNRLKVNGSNYVSIDYNCDHPDYKFTGFNIHKPSEVEIESLNCQNEEYKNNLLKSKLEQLEKLKKEIERLK